MSRFKLFVAVVTGVLSMPSIVLADDQLGLIPAFERAQVVIIGWAHVAVNHVVTDLIREQLGELKLRGVTLALEVTPEHLDRGLSIRPTLSYWLDTRKLKNI